MKINSISLMFSDIDESNARLEILIDPPLADGTKYQDVEFENQPCLELAGRVLSFLSYIKNQEGVEEANGGPGDIPKVVH